MLCHFLGGIKGGKRVKGRNVTKKDDLVLSNIGRFQRVFTFLNIFEDRGLRIAFKDVAGFCKIPEHHAHPMNERIVDVVQLYGLHGPVGKLSMQQFMIDFQDLNIAVSRIPSNSFQRGIDIGLLPFKDLKKELTTQNQNAGDIYSTVIADRYFGNFVEFTLRKRVSGGTDVGNTFQSGLQACWANTPFRHHGAKPKVCHPTLALKH